MCWNVLTRFGPCFRAVVSLVFDVLGRLLNSSGYPSDECSECPFSVQTGDSFTPFLGSLELLYAGAGPKVATQNLEKAGTVSLSWSAAFH